MKVSKFFSTSYQTWLSIRSCFLGRLFHYVSVQLCYIIYLMGFSAIEAARRFEKCGPFYEIHFWAFFFEIDPRHSTNKQKRLRSSVAYKSFFNRWNLIKPWIMWKCTPHFIRCDSKSIWFSMTKFWTSLFILSFKL